MTTEVNLLSRPINFVVVQLPGRKFSGVVVQGDTLHGLVHDVDEILRLLKSGRSMRFLQDWRTLRDQLMDAMRHYEIVCADRGIDPPNSG